MTVINVMKFNSAEGGMVADTQSSTSLRRYDIAEKVHILENKNGVCLLLAGSGVSDFLYEAATRVKALKFGPEFDPKKTTGANYNCNSVREGADALTEIIIQMKRKSIDTYLQSTFGVDSTAAITGQTIVDGKQVPIGQHLLSSILTAYTAQTQAAQELFSNGFLLAGRDSKSTSLYSVQTQSAPILIARPYSSIGSGSDESDKVLLKFIKNLPREKRTNIPFVEGMEALIRATNASIDLNNGVGGVPTIAYFNEKGNTVLGEDSSRLASEIVRVADAKMR